MPSTRFARRLSHLSVTVIGAGRAGSFACLALGMAGIPRVRVFDHDHLDPDRNLGVQLYRATDVHRRRPKVEALRHLLGELCPGLVVEGEMAAFPPSSPIVAGPVVLMAMDTMEARRRSAAALESDRAVAYLVDLRLGGSVVRCHSYRGREGIRACRERLYTDDEAWGAACADSPDPHAALAAASVATASILAFVRGAEFPTDVILDVGAAPCMVAGM